MNVSPTMVKKCDHNHNSYHSNLCRWPWRTLAKTPKAVNENKQCACHSSTKTFLTPLGIGLNKKPKEKVRIQIENRLSKCANKKMQKLHWKRTFLWWGCIFAWLQVCLPLPFIACWQWAKEWQKKENFWVSSSCLSMQMMTKEKLWNLTIKPTFQPWKVWKLLNNHPET